jgi:hypothetical protein
MSNEIHGPAFSLDVDTGPGEGVVRLRLTDEHGRQLGAHQVRLADHKAALWQGLFDTRSFVRTYANSMRFTDRPATAAELLDQIGVFLGETVLGPEILGKLYPGVHQRSLLVRQPAALEDHLAVAFARVPWEIARPAAGEAPTNDSWRTTRRRRCGRRSTRRREILRGCLNSALSDCERPPRPGINATLLYRSQRWNRDAVGLEGWSDLTASETTRRPRGLRRIS